MTIFNANARPVAVTVAGSRGNATFSVAGCSTAMFTWDHGWKPLAGAEVDLDGSGAITMGAMPGAEAPLNFYEVIVGTERSEYVGTQTPSLPPCARPTGPPAPSG